MFRQKAQNTPRQHHGRDSGPALPVPPRAPGVRALCLRPFRSATNADLTQASSIQSVEKAVHGFSPSGWAKHSFAQPHELLGLFKPGAIRRHVPVPHTARFATGCYCSIPGFRKKCKIDDPPSSSSPPVLAQIKGPRSGHRPARLSWSLAPGRRATRSSARGTPDPHARGPTGHPWRPDAAPREGRRRVPPRRRVR